jgi:hypothetical protein
LPDCLVDQSRKGGGIVNVFSWIKRGDSTTKQQAPLELSSKEPRRSRVMKTRSVPRQSYLSSLSDYDVDSGESEFEELLQGMQLPTNTIDEYEGYDQEVSDSHKEEEEELYEDYYDQQDEQDDAKGRSRDRDNYCLRLRKCGYN